MAFLGLMLGTVSCLPQAGAATDAPDVPSHVTVIERTDTTLTVTWDAVPDGVTLHLQAQLAGGDWSTPGESFPLGTGSLVGGCAANTAYDLRIRSELDGQSSAWVVLTEEWTRPLVPTGLSATTAGYNMVTVSWDALPDGWQMNVYRDGGNTGSFSTSSGLVPGGSVGETNSYQIAALSPDSGLESALSGAVDGVSGVGSAPVNTVLPQQNFLGGPVSLTSAPIMSVTDDGTWTGDPPSFSFTYQWLMIPDGSSGAPIPAGGSGLTANFDPVVDGLGSGLRVWCRVTATNAVGSQYADTAQSLTTD